jgi:CRISPR-associated protein Csm1
MGDVDRFDAQLKQAGSIEDHIQLSVLLKDFFAGELSLLCAMADFWRKATILYRGGDDFAILGTWDALLGLARELQRVFDKFVEQNFQTLSGVEGKTISMALALASELEMPLAEVFQDAAEQLRYAKALEPGTFHLFGRTLEWKRLEEAEELKRGLMRLVREFRYSPDYIHDLASVYRESSSARSVRRKAVRVEKPWRIYMRLSEVIPPARGKEMSNLRNALISSLTGKRAAGLKLRPSARVGLEWARMAAGGSGE